MSQQKPESHAAKNKKDVPGAIDLADDVHYAAGSLVSRTLVAQKPGNVTTFEFDTGQGLREHSDSFDALVLILDGEAELVIGGKPVRARSGQMVTMPANIPHAVRAVEKFKMLLTMIR